MTVLTARQKASSCRHFNGIQNETCAIGVVYKELLARFAGEATLPCIPKLTGARPIAECAGFRYPTEAELDADEKASAEALTIYLTALEKGLCPHCGEPYQPARQVGRCVYGICGCRLYQGRLPKKAVR